MRAARRKDMASSKTTAQRSLDEGQSSRLDNISRAMLLDGAFRTLLDRDIVGMTRHPRIVQEATGGSDADEHGRFVHADESVAAICHGLAPDSSHAAAALRRLIYDDAGTGGPAPVPTSPVREDGVDREVRP